MAPRITVRSMPPPFTMLTFPLPLLLPSYFGFSNSTIWGMTVWTRLSANSVIDL
jgi:hypothetical protein